MIPPGKRHSVRLCATFVKTVSVPGRYGDGYGGHGLSLLVTPRKSGGFSKTWAQAVSPNGTKTSLGLGSYPVVTLAMARDRALANARAIAEGRDPRRRMRQVPTFAQANETVLAIHAEHWKSERTKGQWRASMRDYVLPRLARKRVDADHCGGRGVPRGSRPQPGQFRRQVSWWRALRARGTPGRIRPGADMSPRATDWQLHARERPVPAQCGPVHRHEAFQPLWDTPHCSDATRWSGSSTPGASSGAALPRRGAARQPRPGRPRLRRSQVNATHRTTRRAPS